MPKKENLSRGLQSLLGGVIGIEEENVQEAIVQLNPEEIKPNNLQPRKNFKQEELEGLITSIKTHGILQPIIVTPLPDGYMLIAGERRWRAAKQLKLHKVPSIIRSAEKINILELALIENIQREDLNPIEKAFGFQGLIEQFGLTQEQVAKAMGKNRSSVTNYLRLLELPHEIQEHVSRGTLSMGHARALLSFKNKDTQKNICKRAIRDGLSVRDIESLALQEKNTEIEKRASSKGTSSPHVYDLEDRFRKFLGAKVKIRENKGKGQITIAFQNNEEFERIASKMGVRV